MQVFVLQAGGWRCKQGRGMLCCAGAISAWQCLSCTPNCRSDINYTVLTGCSPCNVLAAVKHSQGTNHTSWVQGGTSHATPCACKRKLLSAQASHSEQGENTASCI